MQLLVQIKVESAVRRITKYIIAEFIPEKIT